MRSTSPTVSWAPAVRCRSIGRPLWEVNAAVPWMATSLPGRSTYTKSRPDESAPNALADLDPTFVERRQAGTRAAARAGSNAAVGVSYAEVGAVIARSLGRIFYRDALNDGLRAIVCPRRSRLLRKALRSRSSPVGRLDSPDTASRLP